MAGLVLKYCGLALALLVLAALLVNFARRPSHDRVWVEELSRLPEVTLYKDGFRLANIRDWRWTAHGAVAKDYRSASYAYEDLETVWFVLEPFEGSQWVGHTYLIFSFSDGRQIGLTVEARKQQGQDYSAIKGVLNTYELIYQWADPQDLVSRRADFLQHEQYAWRLKLDPGQEGELLRRLIEKTDRLSRQPRFYNTLWHNCTNELAATAGLDWGWAFILTGRSVRYLAQRGFIEAPGVKGDDLSAAWRGGAGQARTDIRTFFEDHAVGGGN